jgi:hypothetical protein
MAALKQSVVGGQYEYSQGLFFGGKQMQQAPSKFQEFVNRRLSTAQKLIVIDVHTGLGKYGSDTLLVDSKDYDRLRPVFGRRVKAMEPAQGPAYRARGGLPSIFNALENVECDFVGQEFGTFGPLRVLHALREENRWHHHGGGTLDHPAKSTLKQAFCPDDEAWRGAILSRGEELLSNAVQMVGRFGSHRGAAE